MATKTQAEINIVQLPRDERREAKTSTPDRTSPEEMCFGAKTLGGPTLS